MGKTSDRWTRLHLTNIWKHDKQTKSLEGGQKGSEKGTEGRRWEEGVQVFFCFSFLPSIFITSAPSVMKCNTWENSKPLRRTVWIMKGVFLVFLLSTKNSEYCGCWKQKREDANPEENSNFVSLGQTISKIVSFQFPPTWRRKSCCLWYFIWVSRSRGRREGENFIQWHLLKS